MRATSVQKGTDNVKSWKIIADNLSRAGFSWGCSSEIDSTGRVIFTADAYSRDGRRFTVLADERLTAFLELQAAIQRTRKTPMKYWELIADNLNKGGWSLGWVSALDREWRTICIVDAHRDDGKRFVACADEKLTAFLELARRLDPLHWHVRLEARSQSRNRCHNCPADETSNVSSHTDAGEK
jgi:hypothetical protein